MPRISYEAINISDFMTIERAREYLLARVENLRSQLEREHNTKITTSVTFRTDDVGVSCECMYQFATDSDINKDGLDWV